MALVGRRARGAEGETPGGEEEEAESGPSSNATELTEEVEASPTEFGSIGPERETFRRDQAEDSRYDNVRKEVAEIDGEPVEGKARGPAPYFMIKKNLLYWVVQMQEQLVNQLLVPQKHQRAILRLAHSHLSGDT
ncbi:unnamed protein product [Caretta caretta]